MVEGGRGGRFPPYISGRCSNATDFQTTMYSTRPGLPMTYVGGLDWNAGERGVYCLLEFGQVILRGVVVALSANNCSSISKRGKGRIDRRSKCVCVKPVWTLILPRLIETLRRGDRWLAVEASQIGWGRLYDRSKAILALLYGVCRYIYAK
jgi:hypothetical protein